MSTEKQAADYAKLKAKQAKFQVDDGRLVHLKGGVVDRLLYQLTLAFCALGLGLSGKVLYELSYPKKAWTLYQYIQLVQDVNNEDGKKIITIVN